jgi:vitamin B12 transporter
MRKVLIIHLLKSLIIRCLIPVKKSHIVFVLFLCLWLGETVYAQDTNLVSLNEATISENRYSNYQIGYKQSRPDSLIKNLFNGSNLSDLFAYSNSFFVKSYGTNGIASTSIRGGNASQSVINWNGFNINSPMLGQSDLSILPGFLFDDVSILYGGASSLNGSGAMGGSVMLKNESAFNKGINIKVFSDFAFYNSSRNGIAFQLSKKRFTTNTKLYFNKGKNDFLYGDSINGVYTTQHQSHNKLQQLGLMQENQFLLNKRNKLSFNLWLQNSNKQLPANTTEKVSRASQEDQFARTTLAWQYTREKYTLFVRSALFKDALNFTDSATSLYSQNKSTSIINEIENKITINNQQVIDFGINQIYQKGNCSAFIKNINRYAAFASWQFINKTKWLSAKADVRQELIPAKAFHPFTWNTALELKPLAYLSFYANAGKLFRLPTLNDWYWTPGGNPDLKPEDGYTYEMGAVLNKQIKTTQIKFSVSYFQRNVKNWIVWLPGASNVWTPMNLLFVKSKGIETESSITHQYKKLKMCLMLNTNYITSSNQTALNENDESVGRQLIYTPMYSGSGTAIITYSNLSFVYNASYTGYRYTSTDNYEYLNPYYLHNISIAYKLKAKKTDFVLYAKCNNLLNTHYQAVRNNAMPLRNFNIGIQINFNNP